MLIQSQKKQKWPHVLAIVMVMMASLYTVVSTLEFPKSWETILGNTLNLPVTAMATGLVAFCAAQSEGRARVGWMWVALAMGWRFIGSLIWAYRELVLQLPPTFDLLSIGYVFYPIFLIVGFLNLPRMVIKPVIWWRITLDISLLSLSGFSIVWVLSLSSIISNAQGLQLISSLINPAIDVALLATMLVISSYGIGFRPSLKVSVLGLILLIISDVSFNTLSFYGQYRVGLTIDALSVWPQVCFAISAVMSYYARGQSLKPLLSNIDVILYPWGLVTFIWIFLYLFIGLGDKSIGSQVVFVLAAILTFGLMLRQWLTLRENIELNHMLQNFNTTLETCVVARTLELQESQQKLIASENLAQIGRLTAGLAHEINTPLATAFATLREAKLLAQEYKTSIDIESVNKNDHHEIADEMAQRLTETQNHLDRLGEFVRRVRDKTRRFSDGLSRFDPAPLIQESLQRLAHEAQQHQVRMRFLPPPKPIVLYGDESRFLQVVTNIVSNAIHACKNKENGAVDIFIDVNDKKIILRITDNGSGIPEGIKNYIFKPLFSTKESGTGLGLSIVYDIVTGHFGGEIAVESQVGQGTTLTVHFPVLPVSPH
jgi:signal transduction histidine kinase